MPLPSPEILRSSVETLVSQYKKPNRQDTIKVFDLINKVDMKADDKNKIILGALIWIEKDIKYREYKGKNPLAYYPISYSVLYYQLNSMLPALLSTVTQHEKLIYLASFYRFMQQQKIVLEKNEPALQLKVVSDILLTTSEAIKIELEHQNDLVDKLLKRKPAPRYFLEGYSSIKKEYEKYYTQLGMIQRFMHEPDRDKMVEFLDVLNTRLRLTDGVLKKDDINYTIRYGAAIFILGEIDKTYQFLWGSDRSHLYTLCCKITNLKHYADLSAAETLCCYSNLLSYISNELKSPKFSEEWKDLRDAENFLKQICLKLIQKICVIMKSGSTGKVPTYNDKVMKTISYLAKISASYAAGIAVGALSSELTKKTMGASATYLVGPAAGNLVYFLSCAGDYVASSYLPNKISEQVGEKIGSVVTTVTLSELTSTTLSDDSKTTLNYPTLNRAENNDEEGTWITTLLDLPDMIFSEDKKQIIRKLYDPEESVNQNRNTDPVLLQQQVIKSADTKAVAEGAISLSLAKDVKPMSTGMTSIHLNAQSESVIARSVGVSQAVTVQQNVQPNDAASSSSAVIQLCASSNTLFASATQNTKQDGSVELPSLKLKIN